MIGGIAETFEAAGCEPSGFVVNSSGTHRTACAVTLQLTVIELAPLRFNCDVMGLTLLPPSQ